MKTFREHLKEEVVPTALSNGSVDIKNPAVRAELNGMLAVIAARSCITPYIALGKMRKMLSYFHIDLPSKSYMEGDHGVEVWEIHQFGHKMGMTDQGEFVKNVPCEYYLFFHYHLFGSMFMIDAKIVNKDDLDKRLSAAEDMIKEDASARQAIAKATAPKEKAHTALGDCDCSQGDSPSTKAAVDVSMRRKDKKLSADKLDEVSMGKLVAYKNKAGEGREKGVALADKKMKGKAKVGASAPKHPYMEETLDEISHGLALKAMKKSEKRSDQEYKKDMTHDRLSDWETHQDRADRIRGHMRKKFGNDKPGRGNKGEDSLANRKMSDRLTHGKRAGMPSRRHVTDLKTNIKINKMLDRNKKVNLPEESLEEGRMPASVIKHKQRIANMTPEEKAKKFAGKSEEQLKSMARRHGYGKDSNEYSKHGSEKKLDEKAPPGAKFERMVKHIKKGYSKGGLTAKEKSIAYATAWKAKKKEQD